jgi:hypothetical protein
MVESGRQPLHDQRHFRFQKFGSNLGGANGGSRIRQLASAANFAMADLRLSLTCNFIFVTSSGMVRLSQNCARSFDSLSVKGLPLSNVAERRATKVQVSNASLALTIGSDTWLSPASRYPSEQENSGFLAEGSPGQAISALTLTDTLVQSLPDLLSTTFQERNSTLQRKACLTKQEGGII